MGVEQSIVNMIILLSIIGWFLGVIYGTELQKENPSINIMNYTQNFTASSMKSFEANNSIGNYTGHFGAAMATFKTFVGSVLYESEAAGYEYGFANPWIPSEACAILVLISVLLMVAWEHLLIVCFLIWIILVGCIKRLGGLPSRLTALASR